MKRIPSLLVVIILGFSLSAFARPKKASKKSSSMQPDVTWTFNYLKDQGFDGEFLNELKNHYDQKSFERVLRLNHLGFLSPPSHQSLITKEAVNKSLQFLQANKKALEKSQKLYNVPPEVISALLWVETRHGNITGQFHVPSVYLHLLQASREKNRKSLLKIAKKSPQSKKYTSKELRDMIKSRSEWRSSWALEELQALQEIHKSNRKNIGGLRGSFAGAFGIPQFIPSSYLAYSASANSSVHPDLFKKADAVLSVGRYLKTHGWKSKRKSTHVKALMKYNNSRDYAESILELSRKIKIRMNAKK